MDRTKIKCKLSNNYTDMELLIGSQGYLIQTKEQPGFEFLWKHTKTNIGVKQGRFFYELKIIEFQDFRQYEGLMAEEKNEFRDKVLFEQKNKIRIGWSTNKSSQNLGTCEYNYKGSDSEGFGYDNQGQKFFQGQCKSYGETFGAGDVIRCYIDLVDKFSVSFIKNGKYMGNAFKIPHSYHKSVFFPHICVKNVKAILNFGHFSEFFPLDLEQLKLEQTTEQQLKNEFDKNPIQFGEFQYIDEAPEDKIEFQESGEVSLQGKLIMMIGLPGTGKSYQALKIVETNPKNKYTLLSTNEVLNHIVLHNKIIHLEKNLIVLMEICNEIFSRQIRIASSKPKHYIIDQIKQTKCIHYLTQYVFAFKQSYLYFDIVQSPILFNQKCNTLLASRIQKLALFEEFQKEAIVVVIPEIEHKKRIAKKENFIALNKHLPYMTTEGFRTLQENFILPSKEEGFDVITYCELNEEESKKFVLLGNQLAKQSIHPLLRKKNFHQLETLKQERDDQKSQVIKQEVIIQQNDSFLQQDEVQDQKIEEEILQDN